MRGSEITVDHDAGKLSYVLTQEQTKLLKDGSVLEIQLEVITKENLVMRSQIECARVRKVLNDEVVYV